MTDKPVALSSGSNWNLKMLDFEERGRLVYWRKTSQSRDENQQQTQPSYDLSWGIKPRPQWWDVSAL